MIALNQAKQLWGVVELVNADDNTIGFSNDGIPLPGDSPIRSEPDTPRVSGKSEAAEASAAVPRLLDAIDKQNKRLAEIRDAVATIDWAFIRGTGLGLSRSYGSSWVRSWELGDATEG